MKKIDTLSKFYCTVNKPIYYLLSILTITPFIVLAAIDTSGYLASVFMTVSIILYTISMIALYSICKYKRKPEIKRISFNKKMIFILTSLLVIFLSVFLASVISVLVAINNL